MKPLVSIIINCLNCEKYLNKAIKSVLDQTYNNWEIIFLDNNSKKLIKNLLNEYKDSRIKYFKNNKTTSLFEARNIAISKTNGDFIAFLDSDDFWVKDKIKSQISIFNDKEVNLIYSKAWVIEENNNKRINIRKKLPSGYILDDLLLNENFICFSSIMIRKESLNLSKDIFNSSFEVSGDYDFLLRFAYKNYFYCINEPLVFYRIHENNLSKLGYTKLLNENYKIYDQLLSDGNISKNKNLNFFYQNILFIEGRYYAIYGEKKEAFKKMLIMNIGIKKIKLFALIFFPNIFYRIYKKLTFFNFQQVK